MLSDAQFEWARRTALDLAGIELVERHRELLARRGSRSGICDPVGWDALRAAVERGDAPAKRQFIALVTTRFTGFFRQSQHFAMAARHALGVARCRGNVRLWTAGVATGEEAWSLAMALIEAFEDDSPPVRILATDVDEEALAIGQRGEYGDRALGPVGPGRRARFLVPPVRGGAWGLAPVVRRLVEFRAVNLAASDWSVAGPFDVIFCRNVVMYLGANHRHTALTGLATRLAADGLLFLDPAEHPVQTGHRFVARGDGVFALAVAASRAVSSLVPGRFGAFPSGKVA